MTDTSGLPPEQPPWPKRVTCFIHGSSDKLYEVAAQLGLADGDPQRMFSHALDEYKLLLEVKEDGAARLLAIDDKPVLDKELDNKYRLLFSEVEILKGEKNFGYMERNMLVAHLASMYPSGIRATDIEGWDPEWHGCVFIDTPVGQMSWHYHDSQAALFAGLPPYTKEWDGHTTEQKYERLGELRLLNMGIGDAPRKD